MLLLFLQQDAGKAGRHKADDAAHDKGSEGHLCDGRTPVGCHGTEGSDEDAQGTGVGEAADGKGGNSSAAGLEFKGFLNIFQTPLSLKITYSDLLVEDILAQALVGHKLIDYGLGGHHLRDDIDVLLGHTHRPDERDEELGEDPLEIDIFQAHQVAKPADQAIEEGHEGHKGHYVGNDAQDNGHGIAGSTRGGIQDGGVLSIERKNRRTVSLIIPI